MRTGAPHEAFASLPCVRGRHTTAPALRLPCCRDYRPNEALDAYEADGLDQEEVEYDEDAEMAARRQAEAELDERDGGRPDGRGLPRALHDGGASARSGCQLGREGVRAPLIATFAGAPQTRTRASTAGAAGARRSGRTCPRTPR